MTTTLTIRDTLHPGDATQLREIRREYDYLLSQKFELLEQRDTLLATHRSIAHVTTQLSAITERMMYLDSCYYNIRFMPAYGVTISTIEPELTEPALPYMSIRWADILDSVQQLHQSRRRERRPVSADDIITACLAAFRVTLDDISHKHSHYDTASWCKRAVLFFCWMRSTLESREICRILPGKAYSYATVLHYRDMVRQAIRDRDEPTYSQLTEAARLIGYDISTTHE